MTFIKFGKYSRYSSNNTIRNTFKHNTQAISMSSTFQKKKKKLLIYLLPHKLISDINHILSNSNLKVIILKPYSITQFNMQVMISNKSLWNFIQNMLLKKSVNKQNTQQIFLFPYTSEHLKSAILNHFCECLVFFFVRQQYRLQTFYYAKNVHVSNKNIK